MANRQSAQAESAQADIVFTGSSDAACLYLFGLVTPRDFGLRYDPGGPFDDEIAASVPPPNVEPDKSDVEEVAKWSLLEPPESWSSEPRSDDGKLSDVPSDVREPHAMPWTVDISAAFAKSVQNLDKKLQGRILVALLDLFKAPDVPHGDTVKALSGNRRGEWRYRIGDYRLIYKPDRTRRAVVLIEVAARGSAYD
jgi:mRNA interferase RelE/StbE